MFLAVCQSGILVWNYCPRSLVLVLVLVGRPGSKIQVQVTGYVCRLSASRVGIYRNRARFPVSAVVQSIHPYFGISIRAGWFGEFVCACRPNGDIAILFFPSAKDGLYVVVQDYLPNWIHPDTRIYLPS